MFQRDIQKSLQSCSMQPKKVILLKSTTMSKKAHSVNLLQNISSIISFSTLFLRQPKAKKYIVCVLRAQI